MEFREISDNRRVQRPSIEDEDLESASVGLKGEFSFEEVHVEGGDFSGTTGEGRLTRSVLEAVDLSETVVEPLALADVRLSGCVLSNARWSQVDGRRVEVVGSQLVGWRVEFELAQDIYVGDCRADFASFDFDTVKGLVVFERCRFKESSFTGNLSKVAFIDCDLADADFSAVADARGLDLRESKLVGAKGLLSLRGARVTDDQVLQIAGDLARETGLVVD
ncbi:pentapeptide repeat-containing protein [Glycomyces sp. NPDC048151]|uniref:pentapeptide repeat-containing protein n=1 Tax=Glycomyces sp. NPDC048151 TaxID=3364002 RepID=UPI00371640F5